MKEHFVVVLGGLLGAAVGTAVFLSTGSVLMMLAGGLFAGFIIGIVGDL